MQRSTIPRPKRHLQSCFRNRNIRPPRGVVRRFPLLPTFPDRLFRNEAKRGCAPTESPVQRINGAHQAGSLTVRRRCEQVARDCALGHQIGEQDAGLRILPSPSSQACARAATAARMIRWVSAVMSSAMVALQAMPSMEMVALLGPSPTARRSTRVSGRGTPWACQLTVATAHGIRLG